MKKIHVKILVNSLNFTLINMEYEHFILDILLLDIDD